MTNEGIKKATSRLGGLLFLAVLFQVKSLYAQPSGAFTARIPDPLIYGRTDIHKIEAVSDSLYLYSYLKGKYRDCDSIVPVTASYQQGELVLTFPDKRVEAYKYGRIGSYLVLQSDNGRSFVQPLQVAADDNNLRRVKSRNKKRNTQRCPVF